MFLLSNIISATTFDAFDEVRDQFSLRRSGLSTAIVLTRILEGGLQDEILSQP